MDEKTLLFTCSICTICTATSVKSERRTSEVTQKEHHKYIILNTGGDLYSSKLTHSKGALKGIESSMYGKYWRVNLQTFGYNAT